MNIPNVKTIKFRRKGRIGRSIFHGALVGFVFGGIIGLISGDDDPDAWFRLTAEEKAAIGGVTLGLIGGSAGGIVGSFKIKIPINGNQKTYESRKRELTNYKY